MTQLCADMTDLENKVDREVKKSGFKQFLADTTASVTYSFVVGGLNELFVAGMTWEQMLKSRGMATAVNVALGRPYGKFRDYVFQKTKTTEKSGFFRKFFADVAAFATFWVPIYASILYLAGADRDQIMTACGTITAMSGVLGRPYGLYLDVIRKGLGVQPEYLDGVAK